MMPTCPSACVEENHPGREHEQWVEEERWDEGWIAAVSALTPPGLKGVERLMFALDHMPVENPYRQVRS